MLQRLDKRKDRVEISPEQLSDASTQAEVKCNCCKFQGKCFNPENIEV